MQVPKVYSFLAQFYGETEGITFVVDSSDTDRIKIAKLELQKILNEYLLKDCPVLVFANKQDLGVMNVEQVTEKLELDLKGRKCVVMGTCANKGEGLYEGLEWLCDVLASKK